jgi:peptidoglycan/xylan/chitin deacetylase (PgdA/CDA1 family)
MSATPSAKAAFAMMLAVLVSGGALAQGVPEQAAPQQLPPPPPSYSPPPECASRTDLLGISRIVEIDTASGPRFGAQHPAQEFLNDHEIVLTFDDGPMRRYTNPILEALDEQCTKATFFSVGRMAISDPATLQEIARRGHTIGVHTWSHKNLAQTGGAAAKQEIELGLSAVSKALGAPIAPFFRYPYLAESKSTLAYLQTRGLGVFGIHVDSRDFRTKSPGTVMRNVLSQLEHSKKGIILFHDIQPSTAGALSSLLAELKKRGYKVVHMIAKTPATTLPEYDAIAEKSLKAKLAAKAGNPLASRAATFPNQDGGTSEDLPWSGKQSSPKAKPAGQPTRKIDYTNPSDEPWQLKPFGN